VQELHAGNEVERVVWHWAARGLVFAVPLGLDLVCFRNGNTHAK
jgi:hypothetical protein